MGWIHTSFCMGEGFADAITLFFFRVGFEQISL